MLLANKKNVYKEASAILQNSFKKTKINIDEYNLILNISVQ